MDLRETKMLLAHEIDDAAKKLIRCRQELVRLKKLIQPNNLELARNIEHFFTLELNKGKIEKDLESGGNYYTFGTIGTITINPKYFLSADQIETIRLYVEEKNCDLQKIQINIQSKFI